MDKPALKKIGKGFYLGEGDKLYLHMIEFLDAHNLPDTPEVREQIWAEVREQFGPDRIAELDDPQK